MKQTKVDQIEGVFLGIAIGDALGMPVETRKPEEISEKYGKITTYFPPTRKGWENKKAGTTTDDTQLTLAVSLGMLEGGTSIQSQIKQHLIALDESKEGWGGTTTEALKKLKEGCSPSTSGIFDNPQLGRGNGILMKMAPALIYEKVTGEDCRPFLHNLTIMSHNTAEAIDSTNIYYTILKYCLDTDIFDQKELLGLVKQHSGNSMLPFIERAFTQTDFKTDVHEIGGEGKPRFSCRHSLPLSIYCFLTAPHSIESLYTAVSAGGDTDTNASIVGALVGALNGASIFPQHLINGLSTDCYDKVMTHATAWASKT